jgi:hypothetical protein
MVPEVELEFLPRAYSLEPRVRVTVFRDSGPAILDIRLSAIAEICKPDSESREDVMRAFRESLPTLLPSFNRTISTMSSGAVALITANRTRPTSARRPSRTQAVFRAC